MTTTEYTTDGSTTEDDTTSTSTESASTLSTTTFSTSTTVTSNVSSTTIQHTNGHGMDAGTGIVVAIVVVVLVLVLGFAVYYLRKTGRIKCLTARGRPRRSSTSSSRSPFAKLEDNESVDNIPPIKDSDMFAIAEPDEDNERDGGADDGYFYDEVFGSSAFEDETTKVSNKELTSVSSDPEDLVPDLLLRVDHILFNVEK